MILWFHWWWLLSIQATHMQQPTSTPSAFLSASSSFLAYVGNWTGTWIMCHCIFIDKQSTKHRTPIDTKQSKNRYDNREVEKRTASFKLKCISHAFGNVVRYDLTNNNWWDKLSWVGWQLYAYCEYVAFYERPFFRIVRFLCVYVVKGDRHSHLP